MAILRDMISGISIHAPHARSDMTVNHAKM